jgi:hypothetical protein
MKFTTVNSSDYLFTCYNFIPWKKRVNPDHATFQKWETVKWALLFFLKCKKIFSFLSGFRKTYFLSGKVFLSLEKFIAQFGKNFAEIQKKSETMPILVPGLNCNLYIPGYRSSPVSAVSICAVTSQGLFPKTSK